MKKINEIDFAIPAEEMKELEKKTKEFLDRLRKSCGKKAEIFVGGSFVKGTLTKSDDYDIDVFVRFSKSVDLSSELERILNRAGIKFERWHGSRDYFRVSSSKGVTFEVIPVKKISNAKQADNVTDLSYLHVNYVRKNLKGLARDVRLAKQFAKASGVYGAESYVNGFSGYALECLVIYYGGFEKMLRGLLKAKEREVIDDARLYKRKADVFVEMNESKTSGPLILVDPTFKERNVLAALSGESFSKFKEHALGYFKGKESFSVKGINVDGLIKEAKRRKAEFLHLRLESDRQEGDIAGTKMKKFSRYLVDSLGKWFIVLRSEFSYSGSGGADFYLVVKSRGIVKRRGPPLSMVEEVKKFKRVNKKVVSRKGRLWSVEKVDFSAKDYLKKVDREVIGGMGISGMKIEG